MEKKILIAVPTFENIKPECFKSIYGLTRPEGYVLYFDYVYMVTDLPMADAPDIFIGIGFGGTSSTEVLLFCVVKI